MSSDTENSPSHTPRRPNTPSDFDEEQDYHGLMRDVVLQYSPSKSRAELDKVRDALVDAANRQEIQYRHLKRQLVDITNGQVAPRKRTRRSRGHRTDNIIEEGIADAQTLEVRARRFGKKFTILYGLWLSSFYDSATEQFAIDMDEDYQAELRFETEKDIAQGQLREIIDILPGDLAPFRKRSWLAEAFADGMKSQRSNTRTRLRGPALLHIIEDDENTEMFRSPASRSINFSLAIGWQPKNDNLEEHPKCGRYSTWKIPKLHKNSTDEVDFDEVFRADILLKIYASILRGPEGSVGLFSGNSKLPQADCMQRIYQINRTTPGAIASCAVWAIWLYSADDNFVPVGKETGINYERRFNEYLDVILEGLQRKQVWARSLLSYWDGVMFPETDNSGQDYGASGRQQEDHEEREDVMNKLDAMPVDPVAASASSSDEEEDG